MYLTEYNFMIEWIRMYLGCTVSAWIYEKIYHSPEELRCGSTVQKLHHNQRRKEG